ncbi:ferritin-like protein [Streptomyces sp. NPDC088354]|uniref:ferritin-like domain-containing protein n=1 Tax=unclassified Streptomyces TaxID=2593676 RepID=UPI0029AC017F|nr:ferritin-like protein [Streptomyces sp. MI02-7b]MDX3076783.1 ferritin-like protein [Streptomyces sp. MI02-7b]
MTQRRDDTDNRPCDGPADAHDDAAALGRRGFVASAALAAAAPVVLGAPSHAAAPAAPAAAPVRRGTVARLLEIPAPGRDVRWIRQALQVAVQLELSTIPPYLCAWWSVKDRRGAVARRLRSIVMDEMFHMGLACNMLTAVGGRPWIAGAVPAYPGPLPGGVRSELTVYLSGLTKGYVHDVMMGIEMPENPLLRSLGGPPTIGDFYDGLLEAFRGVRPRLTARGQMTQRVGGDGLRPIRTPADVEWAIEIIKEQGEGTSSSPQAHLSHGALGHYYAFAEIYHGRALRRVGGLWEFTGDLVPFPEVRPMGVVPAGGWARPAREPGRLLQHFDVRFSEMLRGLQTAWGTGDAHALDTAVKVMRQLEEPAVRLMEMPLPDGSGRTYGPQFHVVHPAGGRLATAHGGPPVH